MSPAEANEHELWELAAVLGVDPADRDMPDLDERLAREATPEQMRERIERAKIKPRRSSKDPPNLDIPPPPEVEPGEDITVDVMRQMGIS
jgi:hypothetical protein